MDLKNVIKKMKENLSFNLKFLFQKPNWINELTCRCMKISVKWIESIPVLNESFADFPHFNFNCFYIWNFELKNTSSIISTENLCWLFSQINQLKRKAKGWKISKLIQFCYSFTLIVCTLFPMWFFWILLNKSSEMIHFFSK